MRLTSFVRRSTALAAATALISSAGVVTGLLAAPALAATVTVGAISPSQWDNRSSVLVTITGSGFNNADPTGTLRDSVVFVPDASVGDAAHEVGPFEVQANQSTSTTMLTANVNLAMAPAGSYHVVVKDPVSGQSATPGTVGFTVFGYGSANATSVVAGANGTGVDPLGLDCTYVSDCGRGSLSLDINGSNIAVGAKVQFLKPSGASWVPDSGLSFAPGNPNNGSNPVGTEDGTGTAYTHTGYPSTSLLQGNYAYTYASGDTPTAGSPFTPGLHRLQIVNSDGQTQGATVDFVQPWFAANHLTPTSIGAGAQKVTLTVTGQGFRSGATLAVAAGGNSSCGTDVSVGATTPGGLAADGTYTTLSAPVSFTKCAPLTGRAVTVVSPDGARFTRSGILQVTAPPAFASLQSGYQALGQGASVGPIKITGTGFVGAGLTDPNSMTRFSFGPGVTATTVDIIAPSSGTTWTADVMIDVAPDAVTGDRDAVATNPDGGSTTTTKATPVSAAPLTVNAGPKVTSVDPSGFQSSAPSVPVTVTGTFNTSDAYSIDILPHDPGLTFTQPTRTATTLTFAVLTNGATPRPLDLIVTDSADHGRAVCAGCLGVNSLTIKQQDGTILAPGQNASVKDYGTPTATTLTMQSDPSTPAMGGVTSSSTATLTRAVPLAGQGPIVGTGLAPVAGNQAAATFDLLNAAPGKYNLTVVLNPGAASPTSWQCTGCVTVTGTTLTVTGVTPGDAGEGAINRMITIAGTGFSRGTTVGLSDGATVHDVTFVSPTTLTALVDVPADTITPNPVTGAKSPLTATLTVTAGSGSSGTHSFTINPAPSPTSVTPGAYGQGAGTNAAAPQTVTVSGPGLQDQALLALGGDVATTFKAGSYNAGNALTDPSFDSTIGIAQAAVTGKRAVTVINPDGGIGTLADGFTVNPGPKVLSVSNEAGAPILRPDAVSHVITLVGSGFDTHGLTVAFSPATGITAGAPTVVSADKITIPVTVATTVRGLVTVSVTNTADKGYGTCACTYAAVPPSTPYPVALGSGAGSVVASWATPASDGGAPVTAYHLVLTQSGLASPTAVVDVPGTARSRTFTGLRNGTAYSIAVSAINAAGVSGISTASGIAGLASALSVATTATHIAYGGKVIVTGRLLGLGGYGIANKSVVLAFYPYYGSAYTKVVTTNGAGAFSLGVISRYSVKVRALWAGDASYRPVVSTFRAWYVAARVYQTWPRPNTVSSTSTVLRIGGYVLPNKSGRIVYLLRYVNHRWYLVQRSRLNYRSQYVFSLKPGRGTYIFRVVIGVSPGNTAGSTGAFRLYRR
jgi:hypothetical protein